VSNELGEGDTASTNPPAVEVLLLAGAEGATVLALVSPGKLLQTQVASCNSVR
jgi:hypothetical protein